MSYDAQIAVSFGMLGLLFSPAVLMFTYLVFPVNILLSLGYSVLFFVLFKEQLRDLLIMLVGEEKSVEKYFNKKRLLAVKK